VQFQSIPPLATLVIGELAIDYAQLGLLVGLFMLPGIVISVPGGLLGRRFGDRRVVLWGLGMMVAGGLLVALGESYELLCVGRTLSGGGAVLVNVLVFKMVADWFAGRDLSLPMAVLIDSWPFGLALALASLGAVGASTTWRVAIHGTTAFAALAFVALALFYRDPAPRAAGEERGAPFRLGLSAAEAGLASVAGLVWMFFNVGAIVFLSFAPAFLVDAGLAIGAAGVLVSVVMWVTMMVVPLGGYLSDRLGHPGLVIVVASLATAALMGLVPVLDAYLWLMVAIGFLFALPAGAIVSLPVHFLPGRRLDAGYGVFYTWYYLGMAALPPLAGQLRDLSGDPALPLLFAAGLMALAALALIALRLLERR
jgi:predicted MFS family arabinose efflux permease